MLRGTKRFVRGILHLAQGHFLAISVQGQTSCVHKDKKHYHARPLNQPKTSCEAKLAESAGHDFELPRIENKLDDFFVNRKYYRCLKT